ncbi:MAG: glucans biosynthesis glucosyltransferase MdoH [Paraglaciecola sp.]|uniref:glucans biosynthesis glucosyltransferase MdoH n=1 Tax=Paraglaciecola sp. TaxID=1920173 RepID=UPI00273FD0B8|nr:glucans biosynthesis glucosyltransferase MdoH [Paraglaciecola sp.]MDP5032983.1 glucans biosynthesis glucosyltransferase MdoH [Paraglaciecola sp.]MDP5133648.1 glucans biosynthesis glucosyltransferase MdoH [Paraglaciecola sp.]
MALQMEPITVDEANKEPQGAIPTECPLHMPPQDFSQHKKVKYAAQSWSTWLARLITFGGASALTIFATYQMILIVSQVDVTFLQWLMVGFFALTFVWIALAACGAIAGFICPIKDYSKIDSDLSGKKTALLMPIYNEDAAQTCAALLSMGKALAAQGFGEQFEIFIISDSNKPDVWLKETAAVKKLQQALQGQMQVWYRRRFDNKAKKAGNVHEFVSRWGGRYDYMLVLDADSLLCANTLVQLMKEMAADERSGIIQTLPCLYRGDTLFARLQQFAGTIYGPIVANGITAWQGDDGNYWGHNAIIRVSAFSQAAGLPTLGGQKPFSGDILSHDFVEAALIRRAGWSVRMLPLLKGSWEESPPSLSDVAIRDRRWAQGNIQHLAVLSAKGLRWPNRFHMLTGIMGYMASPIWFALIMIGIVMAIQIHYINVEYFSDEMSLFPHWPVFDSERMVQLFVFTMGILLVPKILGITRAIFTPSLRRPLGVIRLILGACVEIIFSVLYAPIFMLIHSKHILDIFRGRDSGWSTQQRQYNGLPWAQLFGQHIWHTLIGLVMTAVLYYYSPPLLLWLAPTLVGLVFSIPLSALSGSKWLAKFLRFCGLLSIPEEVDVPEIMHKRDEYVDDFSKVTHELSFEQLLQQQPLWASHFSMTQVPPAPKRGYPPIDKISAEYKIADAQSQLEALNWMTDKEKLALLSYHDSFTSLLKLKSVNDMSSVA